MPHNAFEIWLKDISIKPELAALYLAVMEDVFKTNEGDPAGTFSYAMKGNVGICFRGFTFEQLPI